jgi:hypothetical protein
MDSSIFLLPTFKYDLVELQIIELWSRCWIQLIMNCYIVSHLFDHWVWFDNHENWDQIVLWNHHWLIKSNKYYRYLWIMKVYRWSK